MSEKKVVVVAADPADEDFKNVFTFLDAHPEHSQKFMDTLKQTVDLAAKQLDQLKEAAEPVVAKFFDDLPEDIRKQATPLVRQETTEVFSLISANAMLIAVLRRAGPLGAMIVLTAAKVADGIYVHFANDDATQPAAEA